MYYKLVLFSFTLKRIALFYAKKLFNMACNTCLHHAEQKQADVLYPQEKYYTIPCVKIINLNSIKLICKRLFKTESFKLNKCSLILRLA